MKIGYTEFSFGYAFTENLIRSLASKPLGAPVFPNLIQEAKLGYDIKIDMPGCPLFFQYKLPELMVKNTAAEIAQHQLPGIKVRFFRMPLMRRDLSIQHQLLMNLEGSYPKKVLYATPCLQNAADFNTAYNAAHVHRRSAFFSPRDIGPLPDDKSHVIAYQDGLAYGYVCSEPKKIPAKSFEDIEKVIQSSFEQKRFGTLEQASADIRNHVIELIPAPLRQEEGQVRERIRSRRLALADQPVISARTEKVAEDLLVSREFARVGLGLDLLIAQPAPDSGKKQQ